MSTPPPTLDYAAPQGRPSRWPLYRLWIYLFSPALIAIVLERLSEFGSEIADPTWLAIGLTISLVALRGRKYRGPGLIAALVYTATLLIMFIRHFPH